MGRKKKILTPEQITELEKLAGYGLNQELIADFFNISDRTLRNCMKEDPIIYAAYKKGKAAAISHAAEKLQQAIDNGNLTAIIFFLKTKAGFKETEVHEVTGSEGDPLSFERQCDFSQVSDENIRALIEIAERLENEEPNTGTT